jgi:hypothetical protein
MNKDTVKILEVEFTHGKKQNKYGDDVILEIHHYFREIDYLNKKIQSLERDKVKLMKIQKKYRGNYKNTLDEMEYDKHQYEADVRDTIKELEKLLK